MTAADLNAIRGIVEARLAAELAESPILPAVYGNMYYSPDTGTTSGWVQCLTSFGTNSYLTVGSSDQSNMITGITVLNIFTRSQTGPGQNFTIGTRLRNLYNRINVSGVYFDAAIGPEVVSASPEGFFQTQVRVTFEYIEEL